MGGGDKLQIQFVRPYPGHLDPQKYYHALILTRSTMMMHLLQGFGLTTSACIMKSPSTLKFGCIPGEGDLMLMSRISVSMHG